MNKDKNVSRARLTAEIGNLQVQIAEYRQILKEMTEKLNLYENKYGTVFRPARNTSNQK